MIAVIDYKAGNLTSVVKALRYLGAETLVTQDPEVVRGAEKKGSKGSRKLAAAAVARKLAVLLHRLWVTGAEYEPLRKAKVQPAQAA